MKPENIKNLIFDFGGVIYQIDFERQKNTFLSLGINGFENLYAQASQNSLFSDLETGKIGEDIFREKLIGLIGKNIPVPMVDELWNSILIDYFHDKIGLLQKLKSKYRLMLLSNTNKIHYSFYTEQFLTRYGYDFNDLFDNTYWSFKIGMRKPDQEIFERVIAENGFTQENALFIDDTVQNTESAEKYGLSSFWLSPGSDVSDLFDANLNLNL